MVNCSADYCTFGCLDFHSKLAVQLQLFSTSHLLFHFNMLFVLSMLYCSCRIIGGYKSLGAVLSLNIGEKPLNVFSIYMLPPDCA